jgi:hypothetical protein
MLERLLGLVVITVFVTSLAGLCMAVVGSYTRNLGVADLGMLLAAPS